jgi:hypothetical protein
MMLGLVGFAATSLGCSRWIDMMPSSTLQTEPATRSIPAEARVPITVDGFRFIQNGAPQNPPPGAEHRFLNAVQETHLFSSVIPLGGSPSSLGDKIVLARLTLNETIDPRSGETAWKGFVIGASMFLLSPVIELEYDYAAHTSLELERWDGQVRRYEARSAGTVRYNLFGATPIMIDELKGQVTEACLNELMQQLVLDTDLYTANSTPVPDLADRSVTVKSRRSVTVAPAAPVISISNPHTP